MSPISSLLFIALLPACQQETCPDGSTLDADGECVWATDDGSTGRPSWFPGGRDESTDEDDADEPDGTDGDEPNDEPDDEPDDDEPDDEPDDDDDDDDEPEDEESCESRAATTCSAGDVYWVDSCGETEDLKEACAEDCLEDTDSATCADVDFRCWETDFDCYTVGLLWVDFECEARNNSDETITLVGFEVYAAYSSDAGDVDTWSDEDWSGSLSLPSGDWVDIPDTLGFALNDDISGEVFELDGDLRIEYGGDATTLAEVEGDDSKEVEVRDSEFCW